MAFSDSLKKITAWGRTNQRSLIVVFGVIAFLGISKPILWPGGLGTSEGKSVTTTVEKDKQGNVIKTVEIPKVDPGKTLWDWLSLLGVPLTLAILGYWLQQKQQKRAEGLAKEQRDRDLEIARQQRERDEKIAKRQRELAANEAKEEVLQVYFDRLSTLLVDKNLLAIAAKANTETPEGLRPNTEEKELLDSAMDVIRARTLSILRRFESDAERKTSVIRFLIEADIVSKLNLDLSNANLSGVNLRYVNLSDANLCLVDLSHADLGGAKLINAYLGDANLKHANLRGANLRGADLSDANLNGAKLGIYQSSFDDDFCPNGANLSFADLSDADFSYANIQSISWNPKTKWVRLF